MKTFEILEQADDVGIRAFGTTREEALSRAAEGMFYLMFDPSSIEEEKTIEVKIKGSNDEELFFNFLDDLLFRFEVHAFLVRRVEVRKFTKRLIEAKVFGEEKNKHHHLKREIKSITYQKMKTQQDREGWSLQVFFDT